MEKVLFVSVEEGDDLIVSFAVPGGDPHDRDYGDVRSLILMRTPQFESLLDDSECGVTVSHEEYLEDEDDILKSIEFLGNEVTITTTGRNYNLDIRRVDPGEIELAKMTLKRMNFDGRFVLRND